MNHLVKYVFTILASIVWVLGCADPTSKSASIGPDGGEISLGELTLSFPKGALTEEHTITLSRLDEPGVKGYAALSSIYRCEPNLVFQKPVRATFDLGDDTRPGSVLWARYLTGGYERRSGVVSVGMIAADIDHCATGFAGTDARCAGLVGPACHDPSHLLECSGKGDLIREITCDCNGPKGSAACAPIEWVNAPWPVGTCLTLARGYDDGAVVGHASHLSSLANDRLHGIDVEHATGCDMPLMCGFELCRVNVGCRPVDVWGENVCIEEVSEDYQPTGRWQFAAHIKDIPPDINGSVLVRHSQIARMGATSDDLTSCDGVYVHIEQGDTLPGGANRRLYQRRPFLPSPPPGSRCARRLIQRRR